MLERDKKKKPRCIQAPSSILIAYLKPTTTSLYERGNLWHKSSLPCSCEGNVQTPGVIQETNSLVFIRSDAGQNDEIFFPSLKRIHTCNLNFLKVKYIWSVPDSNISPVMVSHSYRTRIPWSVSLIQQWK